MGILAGPAHFVEYLADRPARGRNGGSVWLVDGVNAIGGKSTLAEGGFRVRIGYAPVRSNLYGAAVADVQRDAVRNEVDRHQERKGNYCAGKQDQTVRPGKRP